MNPSIPRIRLALKSTKEVTPSSPAASSRLETPRQSQTPEIHPKIYLCFKLSQPIVPEEHTYEHDLSFYHATLCNTAQATIPHNIAVRDLLASQLDPVLATFRLFKDYDSLFNEMTRENILTPVKEALIRARCTRKDREEFPALARAFFVFIGDQIASQDMVTESDVAIYTDSEMELDIEDEAETETETGTEL